MLFMSCHYQRVLCNHILYILYMYNDFIPLELSTIKDVCYRQNLLDIQMQILI